MEPFDSIQKLITERGSADILKVWNEKLRSEFALMEKQFSESQAKIRDLELKLVIAQDQVRTINKLHEEDVRLHRGIEFKRGRRTGEKWMPFCPQCGMLANEVVMASGDRWALCSKQDCKWVGRELDRDMEAVIAEIPL